ncbi:MAG TPA: hypothetical protein GX718_11765 [Brevibacterium sp.]|nr:hypothetical protein [Brevibacterium sp.]
MSLHEDALSDAFETLRGQWVEALDIDAGQTRLVTSRGAVLHGKSPTSGGALLTDDSRLLGSVITASTLAPDGVLTLALARPDSGNTMLITTRAPWALEFPLGAAIAARADGHIGRRPATGPRFATPQALDEWAASSPDEVEQAVLNAAADDWVSPGDVVSALLRSGVSDDREIERRGIDVLARLLVRGDLVAGSIDDTGFHPAPEPVEAVVEHVGTVWQALGGRRPGPGQIGWFDLPPEESV